MIFYATELTLISSASLSVLNSSNYWKILIMSKLSQISSFVNVLALNVNGLNFLKSPFFDGEALKLVRGRAMACSP
jgi:hypothetical protein